MTRAIEGPSDVLWFVDPDAPARVSGTRELAAEAFSPLPVDGVFAFFASAENLERITPSELRFQILTPLPIQMRSGAEIDYRLRMGRIPFRWRTRITEWDPPHAFTDEQIRGPYRTWIHRHTFEPVKGGTLMRDRVQYRLPLSPLGNLATPLVRRQLDRIFRYRQETIGRLLLTHAERKASPRRPG